MHPVRTLLAARRFDAARDALQRLLREDGEALEAWMQLAFVERVLRNPEGELAALRGALSVNPYDLLALLVKGECLEGLGRHDEALKAYRAACHVASQMSDEQLGSELQRRLRHAQSKVNQGHRALSDALDALVERELTDLQGHARDRFVQAVDLLLGRRQRFDPQPMGLYYPQLLQAEFFPRERFPWLRDLEARTEAIRAEFLAVLEREAGFVPYVQYERDQPVAQWAALNQNPDWSVFHLIKEGQVIAAHAAQCPVTMETLAALPQPRQHGRTPVALFSCLKPHTRIPPHVGVSNARLLTHLPLIVPPDCGFRVGSETRAWREGEAFVFDDSVEHEAWNLSDRLRVVLIFDIWHPDLSAEECRLLDALARVQDAQRLTVHAP